MFACRRAKRCCCCLPPRRAAWGAWDDTLGMNTRKLYSFGGTIVAQRDTTGVTYLHGDQGGSVSVATRADGTLSSRQEFDPWGNVRSGGVSSTTLNYTGQRRDDTGLQTHRSLQDAHQRTTSHQRASARFACQTQVLTRGRIRRYVYAANSSARDHRASVQDLPRLDCGARVPRTRPGRSVLRAVRTATTPCVAAQTGT